MYKFYWLDQIKSSDWNIVGEKAFYLADLMDKGYPISPGFVIPANTLWQFLERINWSDPLLANFPDSSLNFNIDDHQQWPEIVFSGFFQYQQGYWQRIVSSRLQKYSHGD